VRVYQSDLVFLEAERLPGETVADVVRRVVVGRVVAPAQVRDGGWEMAMPAPTPTPAPTPVEAR